MCFNRRVLKSFYLMVSLCFTNLRYLILNNNTNEYVKGLELFAEGHCLYPNVQIVTADDAWLTVTVRERTTPAD